MGNDPPPPKKKVSIEDAMIDMKIQSKQVMRAAKKAEKESQKYRKQAKDALKKNNQDFAKLYLTSASQKHTEFLNYQRTGIKMDIMCDQIKSMKNNEKMVSTFTNMTNMVNEQMAQIDTASMMEKMQLFNQKMDEAIINDKMTQQLMSQNEVVDTNADKMLDVLKQQIALEQKNNLNIVTGDSELNTNTNKNVNHDVKYEQTNIQSQGGGGQKQEYHDPFLDQLKGL